MKLHGRNSQPFVYVCRSRYAINKITNENHLRNSMQEELLSEGESSMYFWRSSNVRTSRQNYEENYVRETENLKIRKIL